MPLPTYTSDDGSSANGQAYGYPSWLNGQSVVSSEPTVNTADDSHSGTVGIAGTVGTDGTPAIRDADECKEESVHPFAESPLIPEQVYAALPSLLQEGCAAFAHPRERDVFLTGTLAILSGCLPNLCGCYDGVKVYPSLYSFVVAPPASGKGALTWARALGSAYHRYLLEASREAQQQYQLQLADYEARRKSDKSSSVTKPQPPAQQQLYFPANSSAASLMVALGENSSRGIICETEADSLASTLLQDWGNYSDLLRKAFHHEPVACQRKTNREFIELESPQLSVALSGTPKQVLKLMPSAENGLFSRFLYYAFATPAQWRDVSPQARGTDLQTHFAGLSAEVQRMVRFFEEQPEEIAFEFSPAQWAQFNHTFSEWMQEMSRNGTEELAGSLKRLGLITFRIAMILSAVRGYGQGKFFVPIECNQKDFNAALQLATVYKFHAGLVYRLLPAADTSTINPLQGQLFRQLPDSFARKQAIDLGRASGIVERTINKYLHYWRQAGLLEKTRYGIYQKVN